VDSLSAAGSWLAKHYDRHPGVSGAVSYNLLMLAGTVTGGWQLARAAMAASRRLAQQGADRPFLEAKILTAQFYAGQLMPSALAYRKAIEAGCEALLTMPEEQF
jgi:hypothetical protein